MADVISAEEGALRRGAQAVNEAKAGIDQQVKKVRGEIDQLRGYWQGGAAVALLGERAVGASVVAARERAPVQQGQCAFSRCQHGWPVCAISVRTVSDASHGPMVSA